MKNSRLILFGLLILLIGSGVVFGTFQNQPETKTKLATKQTPFPTTEKEVQDSKEKLSKNTHLVSFVEENPIPSQEEVEVSKPKQLACVQKVNWIPNARQMYDYEYDIAVQTNMGKIAGMEEGKNTIDLSIKGTLNFHTLDVQEYKVKVLVQLSNVQVQENQEYIPELEQFYQTPFQVDFMKDGTPIGFRFPPKIHPMEKKMLKDLIYGLQLVYPEENKRFPSQNLWKLDEKDSLGTYAIKYHVVPDHCQIQKKKEHYKNLKTEEGDALLSARVLSSESYVFTNLTTSWIKAFSGNEIIQLSRKDEIVSISQTKLKLKLIPFKVNHKLVVWNSELQKGMFSSSNEKNLLSENNSVWEKIERRRIQEHFRDVSFEDIFQEAVEQKYKVKKSIQEGVDQVQEAGNQRTTKQELKEEEEWVYTNNPKFEGVNSRDLIPGIQKMHAYLKAYPEVAEEIPMMMKADEYTNKKLADHIKGQMFSALELSGHLHAQRALIEIMNDQGQDHMTRIHAIITASGIRSPSEELIEELWNQVNPVENGEDNVEGNLDQQAKDLRNTALLSIGSLEGTQTKKEKTEQSLRFLDKIRNQIESALKAKDMTRLEVALRALLNSLEDDLAYYGDDIYQVFSPFHDFENNNVRKAAIESLRFFPDSLALKTIRKNFLNNEDPTLQTIAFESFQKRNVSTKFDDISQILFNSTDNQLKALIEQYLGEVRGQYSKAEKIWNDYQEKKKIQPPS